MLERLVLKGTRAVLRRVREGNLLFLSDSLKKIDAINKLNIPCESKKERLEKLLNKFTVSSNKLLYRLRTNQMNNITSSNLFNKFNDIVIVWDNAKAHIAQPC